MLLLICHEFFLCFPNSELNGATPVLAGHTVEGNDFEEKYLDRLFESPKLICVFIQDRVSYKIVANIIFSLNLSIIIMILDDHLIFFLGKSFM